MRSFQVAVKSAGVPGVGDLLALAAAVVEDQGYLPLRVAAREAAQIAQVRVVHAGL